MKSLSQRVGEGAYRKWGTCLQPAWGAHSFDVPNGEFTSKVKGARLMVRISPGCWAACVWEENQPVCVIRAGVCSAGGRW